MNEQFRVAQKVGLMFRSETEIPEDIKGWAVSQLHADSPALGISTKYGKVKSWPQSMQPDLIERARSEERRVGKGCRARWSPEH